MPTTIARAAALALALVAPFGARAEGQAGATARGAAGPGPKLGVAEMDGERFAAQTGMSPRVLHTFVIRREGWGPIQGGRGGRLDEVAKALARDPDRTVVISYPPIPQKVEGPPGEALAKCAAGEFDAYYARYGAGMAERKLDRVIMRVGWEWDGKFPWGGQKDVDQAKLYAACFANVVKSIREAYPGNRILFDYNSTTAVTPALLAAGYPGDAYVDIVSVEGYDNRQGNTPEKRWNALKKVFDMVRDFGQARGKKLAFPEWGVMTSKRNPGWGGGDSPYHVQKVCEYAKDPANGVVYMTYFNRSSDIADSSLESHPESLKAFRTYCAGVPTTGGG